MKIFLGYFVQAFSVSHKTGSFNIKKMSIYTQGWKKILNPPPPPTATCAMTLVDFISPPPYLGQDCMQSRVIDMCPFKVLHWLPPPPPPKSAVSTSIYLKLGRISLQKPCIPTSASNSNKSRKQENPGAILSFLLCTYSCYLP